LVFLKEWARGCRSESGIAGSDSFLYKHRFGCIRSIVFFGMAGMQYKPLLRL